MFVSKRAKFCPCQSVLQEVHSGILYTMLHDISWAHILVPSIVYLSRLSSGLGLHIMHQTATVSA
eukprot:2845388-Rhodomonas_salina.1